MGPSDAYGRGHVPGRGWICRSRLEAQHRRGGRDRARPIVVTAPTVSPPRWPRATLRRLGYAASVLDGGTRTWSAESRRSSRADACARRDRRRRAEAVTRRAARRWRPTLRLGGGAAYRRRQHPRAPARALMATPLPAGVHGLASPAPESDLDLRVLDGTWHCQQLQRDAPGGVRAGAHPAPSSSTSTASPIGTTTLRTCCRHPKAFAEAGRRARHRQRRPRHRLRRAPSSAPRACGGRSAFGHDRVAVLDGGLRAWEGGGTGAQAASRRRRRREFSATPRTERGARPGCHAPHVTSRAEQVVDARSRGRVRGAPSPSRGRACAAVTTQAA